MIARQGVSIWFQFIYLTNPPWRIKSPAVADSYFFTKVSVL
jgi:hypothetical protein